MRRIALGVAVAGLGAVGGATLATDAALLAGVFVVAGGLWYAQPALKRLLVPSPFSPQQWKYAPLAQGIDWENVDRWVDLGSGTGRSLVGMADAVDETRVTAIDPFDGRVILGNGPARARRNAARAGLTIEPVRGDATRVPVAADTHDAVTACRLLHDLSRADAVATVREARRVVRPDGTFGVVALPITHEEHDDPLGYWEQLVEEHGFRVTASGRLDRGSTTYLYLLCEPRTG